jgi:uncharacterized protein YfaS (alpha-2-macroglobulin family)
MKSGLIILLSIVLFAFISCSPSNEIGVKFSPTGEVEKLVTFTVEFDEDLAENDELNRWSDTPYIIFKPEIQGRFKWTDERTLIFSPEESLEPIQEYNATLTERVLFGKKLSVPEESFNFNTAAFDVNKVEFFWNKLPDRNYVISIQANIHFNYPVNPDQLSKYLKASVGGKIADYTIEVDKSQKIIPVNLGEIDQLEVSQDLSIEINKGLESIYGKKSLEDTRKYEEVLPPITKLAITGIHSGFTGSSGWIEVKTTQMVDKNKLRDYISLSPAVEYTIFVTENSFRLEGDYSSHSSLNVLIKKGLPGLYGGDLEFDYEKVVTLADLDPSLNFTDKRGKYMMLQGEQNLQVDAVNVNEVQLEVSKVYRNNLIHFLNRYSYTYYDDSRYNPDYNTGNYGKYLYSKKIELPENKNWLQKFDVNLNEALNSDYKGIYVVNVRSEEDYWVHDSKMVSMSDLAIITKKSGSEILVFINSIKDAQPISEVEVTVISGNNQELFTGVTDHEGMVRFTNIEEKVNEFYPRLIVAEYIDDFNYIDLNETYVETSRFDVGGITQYSDNYNVFMYAERNLYRPGETVNISGIIRDGRNSLIEPVPMNMIIYSPNGRKYREYKISLNEQGSFERAIEIPDFAQTGQYNVNLYATKDNLIATYNFSLEEFVPDKIRVKVTTENEKVKPGTIVKINTDAEFLFGAKAAGLKYESIVQLQHINYRSENYPKFNFNNSSVTNTNFEPVFMDGILDDSGKAIIKYATPETIKSKGKVKGSAFVSVFDLTGRTVSRSATFEIEANDYYLGIRNEGYYFATNENLNFQFIAIDNNDTALNGFNARVELIRFEWHSVLRRDYQGRYYYTSEREPVKVKDELITLNGTHDYIVRVDQSGSYEVRLYKEGSDDYQMSSFYAYRWGSSTASSFQVDKEGRIELVTDKKVYEPGEKAKLLFTAPFQGRMLLTYERNGVYDYQYVDVDQRSIEVDLEIKEEYMPNFYVSATLFKKHSKDNSAPFLVGHGYASVKVEKKSNLLPLSITAPEKVKPNTKQKIKIKTNATSDVYVTLAAVDEGILQIKNYQTPDPYAYMNAKRPLMVDSYDLYKLLLPEIVSSSAAGGVALERELQKRMNPIKSKRFQLVSYWSGIKKTNSNGEVTVELDIPQFNGEVRLMAVAYHNSKFGNAEEFMKVAEDIIVEPEIPRVLSSTDKLLSNISVINTTDKEGEIELTVEVEGPLKVASENSQKLKLLPESTANAVYEIHATDEIGVGKIKISTSGMAVTKNEIEISVRPVSPLVVNSGSGKISDGDKILVNPGEGFVEGTQNVSISLSKFPALKYGKQLKNLIGYPYGCIEQTVSKLFPQIYFNDLVKLVAPSLYMAKNTTYYIKEGLRKIESMQMYDGSMAYWQGGTYSNWWGSVYAAHFMLEARKAGYVVQESVLNNLLRYVKKQSLTRSTYDYVTYEANRRIMKTIAKKEILYSLYVLALAGKGDLSTMNYYMARPELLSIDSKYLLAGAYALMGKMNSYNQFLPKKFSPVKTDRQSGGSFDSEIRANAIILNVLLEVDPNNDQVAIIVNHLAKLADQMYSTQETAFALLALGKAASYNADADLKVDVIVDGKTVEVVENNDQTITGDELNGKEISLIASGEGSLFYFWNVEGIKKDGKVQEDDNLMKVRRTYYDYKTGSMINNNRFKQGQLLLCKISLTGYEKSAENIVITDMVPAGFEIENPRLSDLSNLAFEPKVTLFPDNLDIRDDRLILFTDLQRKKTTDYYYMVRVVSAGEYELPVIGAEAMYDRDFRSFNGAGRVRIEK